MGARGELYKCWDSVGNQREVIGHLRSWRDPNDRVLKWLRYDPFTDEGCRACIALPTCMGGCAHHAMLDRTGDSKCSTFRTTYREQVEEFAAAAEAGGGHRAAARAAAADPGLTSTVGQSRRRARTHEGATRPQYLLSPAWRRGIPSSYTGKEVVQS